MDPDLKKKLSQVPAEERQQFVALHNVLALKLQTLDVRAYRLLSPFSSALLEPVRSYMNNGLLKREEAVAILLGAALTLSWEPHMGESGWEKSATVELAQEMIMADPTAPVAAPKPKGGKNGK